MNVVAETQPGKVLRCACGTPWAEVQNGCLVIKSRHRGEQHVNVITLAQLVKLLAEQGQEACQAAS